MGTDLIKRLRTPKALFTRSLYCLLRPNPNSYPGTAAADDDNDNDEDDELALNGDLMSCVPFQGLATNGLENS